MKLPFYVLCLITFSIAGCATYNPRPISAQDTASAFESRTLDSPGLQKFIERNLPGGIGSWPPVSWDFRMLTLAALYYSPDLAIARAKRQVARAGKITAGERPNPSISVRPGVVANPSASPFLFALTPSIPIETAGKRGLLIAEATHLARAASLNVQAAAWQVRSRLRTALLDFYYSLETAAVLKRQVAVQRELTRMLSVLLKNGEIPRPELARAQISLDSSRLKWMDAQRQIADSRARLAAALGVPVQALDRVKISYGFFKRFPSATSFSGLRKKALFCRPDILSALARYEAAQSALQLEIAKQYPDVNIGPGYSFSDSENQWTLGVSLTLPLFNQNQGPIAQARARRRQAAADFRALQAGVVEQLGRGETGYREALLKLKTAEALVAAARGQLEAARFGFRQGETSRFALLGARLVFYADLLQRIRASYQAQQALGQLEDALH
ncbi:MAG: TolC family protein [Syntrophobacteraceae bacterium]